MGAALFAGFFTGLSLVVAIGAQNAFVLRQGLRREHIGWVIAICALSDALLISAGVAGFGSLNDVLPWFAEAALWLGVAFLVVYGALRFKAALRGGEALMPGPGQSASLRKVALTALLFTWANPHVWLDTVVLLGSISTQYAPYAWAFGAAAVAASLCFFTLLGLGAKALAPIFARPKAWVVLEIVVGVGMWLLALGLIVM